VRRRRLNPEQWTPAVVAAVARRRFHDPPVMCAGAYVVGNSGQGLFMLILSPSAGWIPLIAAVAPADTVNHPFLIVSWRLFFDFTFSPSPTYDFVFNI